MPINPLRLNPLPHNPSCSSQHILLSRAQFMSHHRRRRRLWSWYSPQLLLPMGERLIQTAVNAPDEINRGRTATNIIALALIINTVRDIVEGGLVILEWLLVVYLLLLPNLGILPWYRRMLYSSRSSVGCSL